jgi:DNA-binding LytR/AlgR family response regulator
MLVALCDDNKIFLEDIHHKLMDYLPAETQYVSFESGDDFLKADIEPDYIFLDIEMPGMDGIELKNRLEEANKRTHIVFLTSYSDRIREAFGNRVIGFLDKPVSPGDLMTVINKILKDNNMNYYEFDDGDKHHVIPFDEILFINSDDKYTYLNTSDNKKYCIRKTLKEWDEELPKELFCRINRSHIINYCLCNNGIKKIKLPGNKETEVSRLCKNEFKKGYSAYLLSNA